MGGAVHGARRPCRSRRRSAGTTTPAGAAGAQAVAGLGRVPAPAGVGLGRDPFRSLQAGAELLRDHRSGVPPLDLHAAVARGDCGADPGRVPRRPRSRRVPRRCRAPAHHRGTARRRRDPDPAGRVGQRATDDRGRHPQFHGVVLHRAALRASRGSHRPGARRELLRSHQRPSGRTSRTSATPRSWPPSSNASATTTTRCGCTPPSATSPQATNTKDEETSSAKPVVTASPGPTRPAEPPDDPAPTTARSTPDDAGYFPGDPSRELRSASVDVGGGAPGGCC